MKRVVEPELLDDLPARDPQALRSRRDIQRLNRLMGHPALVARGLERAWNSEAPCRLIDLGAGDGQFLLQVARRLRGKQRNVEAILIDRLDALDAGIRNRFGSLGWSVRFERADALEWLERSNGEARGTILTNLLLHQFPETTITDLFRHAASSAQCFIALEPRRGIAPLLGSRLLGLLGCGPVTRHDGVVSVRAGFAGRDLSALWPRGEGWHLTEKRAGLFSHVFIARRSA